MHGLTGGSWKRNNDRARATEMKDTRGNPVVTSGSETYRRSTSPRQLSTLREVTGRCGLGRFSSVGRCGRGVSPVLCRRFSGVLGRRSDAVDSVEGCDVSLTADQQP